MAGETDSAGVYFLSVEDFEWRPAKPSAPPEREDRGDDDAEPAPPAKDSALTPD